MNKNYSIEKMRKKKRKYNEFSDSIGCNRVNHTQPEATNERSLTCSKLTNCKQDLSTCKKIMKVSVAEKDKYKIKFRCVLAFITVVIYFNSLNCDFVYDDRRAILENRNVFGSHEVDSWFQILKDDFWGTPIGNAGSHKSYRPLVTLSFKLQAYIQHKARNLVDAQTKPSAFGYHLVNLLLHLCVVDLVFQLLTSKHLLGVLCKSNDNEHTPTKEEKWKSEREPEPEAKRGCNQVACVTSLLFACHPIHVEAVTSLVGRAELMGTIFVLLSFKSLTHHLMANRNHEGPNETTRQHKGHDMVNSALFATIACLSKENCGISVISINLLLILWLALKSPRRQLDVNSLAVMLALASAFIAVRIQLNLSSSTSASSSYGQILPKFSRLDNPLAQNARQFCLRHPIELIAERDLASTTNQQAKLEVICSNYKVLNKIERSILSTRLYLPAFNLKLLAYPGDLSYDWSLESIGLVKSPLEARFLIAMTLYFTLCVFLAKWLNKLVKINILWQQLESSGRSRNSKSSYLGESELSDIGGSESDTSSVRSVDTIKSSDSGFCDTFPLCRKGKLKESQEVKKKMIVTRGKNERNAQDENNLDPIGWSLVWMVIPHLPASNLFIPVGFLVAERTLYLPSLGFCLLSANLLNHLPLNELLLTCVKQNRCIQRLNEIIKQTKFKTIVASELRNCTKGYITTKLVLIFPLLILGALKTVERNEAWRNEISLFNSNLKQSPVKSMANLASLKAPGYGPLDTMKVTEGGPNTASELLYRAALRREPYSADLHYNLRQRTNDDDATEETKLASFDSVEYHYKLALKLRKNFPLAALNLGAYQYGALNQLTEAWQTFELCAFQMNPNETKTFYQHVQIQIECLISGAKLRLDLSKSLWQTNSATKQTTTAVVGSSAAAATRGNGPADAPPADCPKVLEWMRLARSKAQQIGPSAMGALGDDQFGDLNKQMATIHWIQAQCDDKQTGRELKTSIEFAMKSQVSIAAKIYTSYADFLLFQKYHQQKHPATNKIDAIEVLNRSLEAEKRKQRTDSKELAILHHKLAHLVPLDEALKQMDEAVRLQPNDANFLSFGAQIAYKSNLFNKSEQLYSRALGSLLFRGTNNTEHVVRGKRKLASAHANYGAIMQVNGRLDKARVQYRLALDCDPLNSVAATNLRRLELAGTSR